MYNFSDWELTDLIGGKQTAQTLIFSTFMLNKLRYIICSHVYSQVRMWSLSLFWYKLNVSECDKFHVNINLQKQITKYPFLSFKHK